MKQRYLQEISRHPIAPADIETYSLTMLPKSSDRKKGEVAAILSGKCKGGIFLAGWDEDDRTLVLWVPGYVPGPYS